MFRRIAGFPEDPQRKKRTEQLFRAHPIQISALMELAWSFRVHDTVSESVSFGYPQLRSEIRSIPPCLLEGLVCPIGFDAETPTNPNVTSATGGGVRDFQNRLGGTLWHHLIYAYLIENTRVYEIFRKVIHEFRNGERLGLARVDTQHWLRITEELFYRDQSPYFISSLVSDIRPDVSNTRRNLYFRMFGMDLNHKSPSKEPYFKPEAHNKEFTNAFENFLHQVWIGVMNTSNSSGPDPTDDAIISNYANQLFDMFISRRQYGNISREEFNFVSMMSWFHLTLEYNSPIVLDLRAEGSSPEQRLANIAQRVGIPSHSKSEQFFRMAPLISKLFILIETGIFNEASNVPQLYTEGEALRADNFQIIADWEQATGHNIRKRNYANVK